MNLVAGAYAPGTIKNIRSNMRMFVSFMIRNNFQLFPPVVNYIAEFYSFIITKVKAMGTLQNHQSSVNTFYKLYGFTVDTSAIIFKLLNMAAKKRLTTVPAEKPPLEIGHILAMGDIIDYSDPSQFAFFTAVSIGFMATLRRSNICPPSAAEYDPAKHLNRQDVVCNSDGVIVVLRWSKTNQAGQQLFKIPIAFSQDSRFDPPSLFRQFDTACPVAPSDPCFSFYQHGTLFVMTHQDLSRMLSQFLTAIGVHAAAYSSHSIRKGGAAIIHRSGIRTELLKQHGTWRSDAYQAYLHHSYRDKLSVSQSVYQHIRALNQ